MSTAIIFKSGIRELCTLLSPSVTASNESDNNDDSLFIEVTRDDVFSFVIALLHRVPGNTVNDMSTSDDVSLRNDTSDTQGSVSDYPTSVLSPAVLQILLHQIFESLLDIKSTEVPSDTALRTLLTHPLVTFSRESMTRCLRAILLPSFLNLIRSGKHSSVLCFYM